MERERERAKLLSTRKVRLRWLSQFVRRDSYEIHTIMMNHTDVEKTREESINNDSKTIDRTLTANGSCRSRVCTQSVQDMYSFVYIRSD